MGMLIEGERENDDWDETVPAFHCWKDDNELS